MRILLHWFVLAVSAVAGPLEDFEAAASQRYGAEAGDCAHFLIEHMPAADRESLSAEFLLENLRLALAARSRYEWAKSVPREIFLNDVLPYAVFDEPRDPWRGEFAEIAGEIVKDAKSLSDAAQALNREFFKRVNVHYHTGRKRPNQSPKESMAQGIATCSGLSIILVDACRAVGIPARAVGTPMWSNGRGNHTWVEIWDGGWHFTGADEYDKNGLDRGWFVGDAAKAKPDVAANAIYATAWERKGLAFPLVWAPDSTAVAAVNVTDRYTAKPAAAEGATALGVRLFAKKGGQRVAASVVVLDEKGKVLGSAKTKAGTHDLNDMPRFDLKSGTRGILRFSHGGKTRDVPFGPLAPGDRTVDATWD